MATFGNTGASALVNSSTAAYNKTQGYNDSLAGYVYELSPKEQSDYNTYQSYLAGQAKRVVNDPTKTLSYQKAIRSSTTSFTSAEISRASMAVDYGESDNRTKYSTISALRDAAIQNGDYSSAQSLQAKMASLSMTIQNADAAAASKAQATGDRNERLATAATDKGYTQAIAHKMEGLKELKAAKLSGSITPANYDKAMRQIYMGVGNEPGLIGITQDAAQVTSDPSGKYQSRLDSIAADSTVQGLVNGNGAAMDETGNKFGQTIIKNQDGTYAFHQRPASEVSGQVLMKDANGKPVMDANGHAITVPQYTDPQAFTDKKGGVTGFQYMSNIDEKGNISRGTGQGVIKQINGRDINTDDPSGVSYFYNEAGQKKFIGKDAKNGKPIMANDPKLVNGKDNFGSTNAYGQTFDSTFAKAPQVAGDMLKSFADKVTGSIPNIKPGFNPHPTGIIGAAQNTISGMLGIGQNHAVELAKSQAALKAAQDATTRYNAAIQAQAQAKSAANAKLLPVFQRPQAPVINTKNPAQMRPALGQPGYVPPVTAMNNVPKTGNNTTDAFKAVEALRGGFY